MTETEGNRLKIARTELKIKVYEQIKIKIVNAGEEIKKGECIESARERGGGGGWKKGLTSGTWRKRRLQGK